MEPVRCTDVLLSLISVLALASFMDSPAAGQCVERCVVLQEFVGEFAGDQFGWVSDDVGDLDLDGVDDLALTSPGFGQNVGRVYVYSGATGALLFAPITGTLNFSRFGHDVDPAFDVNGDGRLDIVVGAPMVSTGMAHVYSGADGSLVRSFSGVVNSDQFGASVIGLDDITGDGIADIAVSAPRHDAVGIDAGRVTLFSGADGAVVCNIDGPATGARFGSGMARVGDLDHDGLQDFAVGAPNAGAGAGGLILVYLTTDCLLGDNPAAHHVLVPPLATIDFGLFFIDGGDLDGDGTNDIYGSDFSTHRAFVFSGVTGGVLRTFSGSGGFGIGRFVGDLDDDGADDLILASWVHPGGATQAGRADIRSGADASIMDVYTHDVPFAQFGFDANGMGDVDGDGHADFLVTAANDTSARGRAYLLQGRLPDGDLDGDDVVGIVDLLTLLAAWGPCPDCDLCPSDLDNDCVTGITDLLSLLGAWG